VILHGVSPGDTSSGSHLALGSVRRILLGIIRAHGLQAGITRVVLSGHGLHLLLLRHTLFSLATALQLQLLFVVPFLLLQV
jgi:hypothetical protein